MFLKSTPIRNGIAFLEPGNVTLKGDRTPRHQQRTSSLRKQLGCANHSMIVAELTRTETSRTPPEAPQPGVNPPAQPAHRHQPPPAARPPSPPANIDDMYADDDVGPDVLREMAMHMDEAIDMQANQRIGIRPLPPARPPSPFKEKPASSKPKQPLHLDTTVPYSLKPRPLLLRSKHLLTSPPIHPNLNRFPTLAFPPALSRHPTHLNHP
jgi:hypothetical protein